jgi:hypothetical protein
VSTENVNIVYVSCDSKSKKVAIDLWTYKPSIEDGTFKGKSCGVLHPRDCKKMFGVTPKPGECISFNIRQMATYDFVKEYKV